jgi:hypothetical protein
VAASRGRRPAERLTTPQIVELITLIGFTRTVDQQLNAWRVPAEATIGPIELPSGWRH